MLLNCNQLRHSDISFLVLIPVTPYTRLALHRHPASITESTYQHHGEEWMMVMQITNDAWEKLDVRSIRMMKLLLDTRSVTKAGEALEISQPAASRVLAQLRHALGDPLLVRGRNGNTLTPRAESLRPMVTEALHAISTLFAQEVFEAKCARLTLRVAATDNGAAAVLAPLVQQLSTLAPNVTIDVSPWSAQ